MPSEPTYRHRRRLLSAGPRDIQWLHARPHLWTPAHLDLLVERIDELAREEPKVGYAMATQCLGPIVDQVGEVLPVDLRARGLIAEAKAARRMGLHAETRRLYERVGDLGSLSDATLTRWYRCRAVLAFNEEDFEGAEGLVEKALSFATAEEERAITLVIRGNIRARRTNPDSAAALEAYGEACLIAPAGSKTQIDALLNLSALSTESGTLSALHHAGACLSRLRTILSGKSTRATRRIRAYIDWLEGRLLFRLSRATGEDSVEKERALQRMRRAAFTFVGSGFVSEALLCSGELAAALASSGSAGEALGLCAEILSKVDDSGVETHREARTVLATMVEAGAVESKRLETLRRKLSRKAGRLQ